LLIACSEARAFPDDEAAPVLAVKGDPVRARTALILVVLSLPGCAPGGYLALPQPIAPERAPFDAFQASMRLAQGMPREVALQQIGWTPISSQVTTCGVLAADANPCEVLTFGNYDNNQLLVYFVPTDHGYSIVTSWTVHKR
jgi:hypothetical protein